MRTENPLAEERTIAQWVALVNNVSGSGGELLIRRKICKSLFNSQFDCRDGLWSVDGALNRLSKDEKFCKNTPYSMKTQNRENFAWRFFGGVNIFWEQNRA